jgi:hypothetical protein
MSAKVEARLSALRQYIEARQAAYILHRQGIVESPDYILRAYRFPNVIRNQDKTTQWIQETWARPYYKHPRLWFALILARVFNLPRTLSLLGFPGQGDPKEWRDHALQVLAFIRESGTPVFSSAYPITPHGHKGDKARIIVHDSLYPALVYFSQERTWETPRALEEIWGILMLHLGLGPVVCSEIAADFSCTKYHRQGTDLCLWGFVSPPAIDALCHIYGRQKIDQAEAREMVREVRKVWPEKIPCPFFVDLEHTLVGFSRYLSAKNGSPISKKIPKIQSPGAGPDGLPWAKGAKP